MKFTIPFNMHAFLATVRNPIREPSFGSFVWGYRTSSPVIFIGMYRAVHQANGHTCYTIELLDGGSIDVDGLVTIPDQFLPYVVARDNKVHRVQRVIGDTLTTTRGHEFCLADVQSVLYRANDNAKAEAVASESDLPNRVREEGV